MTFLTACLRHTTSLNSQRIVLRVSRQRNGQVVVDSDEFGLLRFPSGKGSDEEYIQEYASENSCQILQGGVDRPTGFRV